MSIPRLSSVSPAYTIPDGRVSVRGEQLPVGIGSLPDVRVNGRPARIAFASPSDVDIIVSAETGGHHPIELAGVDGAVFVHVGATVATGLHQVDNPVIDRAGNLYLTYSGSRGQQVPVSVFRVPRGGTRESFSSTITNPTSMAISPDGHLYVSSRFEGAIYRLNDDGTAETHATDLGIACGLAFTPDGTLYVGDRSGTIFSVDRTGRATSFATLPSSVAAFHLAVGPDALYVTAPTLSARDCVYKVSFDGSTSVYADGFGRPQGLGFAPDGTLWVVDALAGRSGLYRAAPDGRHELMLSGPRLIGFTFESDDSLIVCTSETAYRLPWSG